MVPRLFQPDTRYTDKVPPRARQLSVCPWAGGRADGRPRARASVLTLAGGQARARARLGRQRRRLPRRRARASAGQGDALMRACTLACAQLGARARKYGTAVLPAVYTAPLHLPMTIQ